MHSIKNIIAAAAAAVGCCLLLLYELYVCMLHFFFQVYLDNRHT